MAANKQAQNSRRAFLRIRDKKTKHYRPVKDGGTTEPPTCRVSSSDQDIVPADVKDSVATNIGSPESPPHPFDDVLAGTENLNLNKRPNLTIFQKTPPAAVVAPATSSPKKAASKKKTKKEEVKVDLWDLMQSAGIGDEELDTGVGDLNVNESIEISADSELLAQLQASQTLQIPGGLRVAVGEDGRPVLIDGNQLLIPDDAVPADGTGGLGEPPVLNLTPQALATAQSQLTQLLQDHGTITPADQQLLNQIFTVNPSQGLTGLGITAPSVAAPSPSPAVHNTASSPGVSQSSGGGAVASTGTSPPPPEPPPPPTALPPEMPPLTPDSLVITNNNGVPTLVASPALLEYLQTHQGIIQFQHDPITNKIQPSLIIPHPQASQASQQTTRPSEAKSPRLQNVTIKDMGGGTGTKPSLESGQSSLANIFRNENVPPNVKMSMARMIQENPSLMQVARDTSSLITYKESNTSLSETELAEIDRKITNNKNLLDQCFHMEMEKGGKENLVFQMSGASTQELNMDMNLIKAFPGAPSTNSPNQNSDFQNKFLESIGMGGPAQALLLPPSSSSSSSSSVATKPSTTAVSTTVATPTPSPAAVTTATVTPKRNRKKKAAEKPAGTPTPPPSAAPSVAAAASAKKLTPPVGNLTFNIKQLSQEQNERLNIALNARGVTANRVAMCEMTEVEKQIIEEEIRRVTGGTLGNTTVKFFPPPNLHQQQQQQMAQNQQPQSVQQQTELPQNASVKYILEDEPDLSQSQMVINNPNLNQLLDAGMGGAQVVQFGNQVINFNQPPPPGSVIVGSNGQVLAFVQPSPSRQQPAVPTIQLTAQKQQMLKSVQSQIQTITCKPTRTATDNAHLDKLIAEQQKILQSGKIISGAAHGQAVQIINQSGSSGRVAGQPKGAQAVSTGTSTCDMPAFGSQPAGVAKGGKQQTMMVMGETPMQYGPVYVTPNTHGKHVTKCEKGTSPIQIQMGTQTTPGPELRSVKMSTGTMTSPNTGNTGNTGKPQAVVAPAVVHNAQAPEPTPPVATPVKLLRAPPPPPAVSRTTLIEKQMLTDQAGACHPDTYTPFLSTSDAVKRLMRYHVMDEKGLSQCDLEAADDMFDTTACHLLDKFRVMKDKYKYLLLLESTREVSTAERIMVDRNFIIEERIELEDLRVKEEREQQLFLNPPPPPPPPPVLIKTEPLTPVKAEPPDSDVADAMPIPNLKTEDTLTEAALMELGETLESDSDSLSSFGADFPPESLNSELQPDSADISAQVQSAIDSILNLRQSGDEDDRRKRKRLKAAAEGTKSAKKSKRREAHPVVEAAATGSQDPSLEEAIRSILS